jgi:hypothetical protein
VPSFESGTCRIVNRNADHSTTTIDLITGNILEETEERRKRKKETGRKKGTLFLIVGCKFTA